MLVEFSTAHPMPQDRTIEMTEVQRILQEEDGPNTWKQAENGIRIVWNPCFRSSASKRSDRFRAMAIQKSVRTTTSIGVSRRDDVGEQAEIPGLPVYAAGRSST
jgi:hypothetical protein